MNFKNRPSDIWNTFTTKHVQYIKRRNGCNNFQENLSRIEHVILAKQLSVCSAQNGQKQGGKNREEDAKILCDDGPSSSLGLR